MLIYIFLLQLRLLDEASSLQSLKPLCKEFILAKIKIIDPGCVDFKKKLMVLHDMLIDQTCDMAILNEVKHSLILYQNGILKFVSFRVMLEDLST